MNAPLSFFEWSIVIFCIVIFSTYAISISLEKNSSISDATDEGGFFV